MSDINDFRPGDSVKINCDVYTNKWKGWEELYRKYGHHNGEVDSVIDMSDVDGAESIVIVGFPYRHCNKIAIKPSYLDNTTIRRKR